jgi:chemotaxis protein methyltransferase CheR
MSSSKLTSQDFNRLSGFIYNNYGIKLPITKKTMLESRLQKRLTKLGFTSYTSYCDFLFSKEGLAKELVPMIDIVTTNKTDFFRESSHFKFLTDNVLPKFNPERIESKSLRIWSAACSSGEEPYSIAITLKEYSQTQPTNFTILGTDISSEILEKAKLSVYDEEKIEGIPLSLKKKYFLKSKDRAFGKVKLMPEIRSHVSFKRLNLMDKSYEVGAEMDIIFCRNVLIYFDRSTQEAVINKLAGKLKRGGYFFLGHSESISNMRVPLQQIVPTIFRKL